MSLVAAQMAIAASPVEAGCTAAGRHAAGARAQDGTCGPTGSSSSSSSSSKLNIEALQRVREHTAAFAGPQDGRGAWVVFLTAFLWIGGLLLGRWLFSWVPLGTWWGLALAACWGFARVGSYVRCFVIMHDAAHNALFSKPWLNRWTGVLTGMMVGMDMPDYQRTHVQHHAVLGIEEDTKRDPDLTILWTTEDWAAWPRGLSKAAARVLYDPTVFFTVFAPVWFLCFNVSWPHRVTHESVRRRTVYALEKVVFVAAIFVVLIFALNLPRAHVVAELVAQQLALSYAMFLVAVEHNFEGVYRVPRAEYTRTAGTLLGSSYLPIPWWWRWATAGVEYHHIHHMNAAVPCYRLQECESSAPPGLWEAAGVRVLTARDGFRALLLALWDTEQRRYVAFPEWKWLDDRLAAAPQKTTT